MVLKKSNNGLNTGATMRFHGKMGFFKERYRTSVPIPGSISVILDGHQFPSPDNKSQFQDALDKIYQSLEWDGPHISEFYDRENHARTQGTFNVLNYMKTNKDGCLSLRNKIERMTETNVLEQMAQNVEFEINIKKYLFNYRSSSDVKLFSWKSTDKSEEHANSITNKKLKRKMRITTHRRGIQRLTRQKWFTEQDDLLDTPSRKIQIDIQEPHVSDARLLTQSWPSKDMSLYHREKSLIKCKGYVNGVRSDFKGYSHQTIKDDIIDYMYVQSSLEDDNNFDCDDRDEYCDYRELDDEEHHLYYSSSGSGLCLSDYINRKASKLKSTQVHGSDRNKMNLTPVNPASSEEVVKHPKGSYVFIKDTSVSDYYEDDSGFESANSSVHISDDARDGDIHGESFEDLPKEDTFHINLDANISNFISKFIPVQLVLPQEFVNLIPKFPLTNNLNPDEKYPVKDCNLTIGNCYPPTFCVKVNAEKSLSDNNWYLIGKAMEDSEEKKRTWLIHIGNSVCDEDPHVEGNFFKDLHKRFSNEICLLNLVECFQEYIATKRTRSIETKKVVHDKMKPKQYVQINRHKERESPWMRLKHIVSDFGETLSIEDALNTISRISSTEPSTEMSVGNASVPKGIIKSEYPSGSSQEKSQATICDICYLPCHFSEHGNTQAMALVPCGHVFCFSCWSSHAHIGLRGGGTVQCMDSDCDQVLNEAALRSLAPGNIVSRWHRRIQEIEIERNPKARWCPNTQCNRVAVMEKVNARINSFGSLVLCDCRAPWCFSCQEEPHWPASCDQMAAFRKLLSKTGNKTEIPLSTIDFTVEVKPCPKCHYPIEKNLGCPAMNCRMCSTNFCWNCLGSVCSHNVYSCINKSRQYVTYNLQNKLVNNIPVKYFLEYLDLNKKREELDKNDVLLWLHNCLSQKCPKMLSSSLLNEDIAKENMKTIVHAAFHFLREVYIFLESFYSLLSFVNMNKEKPRKVINFILREFSSSGERLRFIAQRLEVKLMNKRLSDILKHIDVAQVLIECGKKELNTLKREIYILQDLTAGIDTYSVGELDPAKNVRYM